MPKLNRLKLTVEQGDELYRFLQARTLVKQYQDRSHELVYDNDGTIDAYASLSALSALPSSGLAARPVRAMEQP